MNIQLTAVLQDRFLTTVDRTVAEDTMPMTAEFSWVTDTGDNIIERPFEILPVPFVADTIVFNAVYADAKPISLTARAQDLMLTGPERTE